MSTVPADVGVVGVRRESACENGAVNAKSLPRALHGIVAADFSDPTNERIIYLSAAGLAVVGLALLVGTILWWRRARQEHPSLGPLEVMGGRAWAKAPEGDRRRRLDHVRRSGAGALADGSFVSEPVDLEALVRSVPEDFDDLREPSAVIALPPPEGEPVSAELVKVDDVAEVEPAKQSVTVEPAKQSVTVEPAKQSVTVEPANQDDTVADPDATAVSMERPSEAFASGPTDPSS
jgi:hypothetical protein